MKSPSCRSLGRAPAFSAGCSPGTQGCWRGTGTGLSLGCPSAQAPSPTLGNPLQQKNEVSKEIWVSTLVTLGPASSRCVAGGSSGEQNLLVATVWSWHKAIVETLLEMKSLTGEGLAATCRRAPLKFSCVFPALISVRFSWMIHDQKAV